MLRSINPTVPTTAKTSDRQDSTVSTFVTFLASSPRCRSHLSAKKARSRKTVVTQQPAVKRGLRLSAPTSDIYAMV